MLQELGPLLGVIGGVSAILVAVVAGVVILANRSRVQTTLDLWREENSALSTRLTTMEQTEKRCREDMAALTTRYQVLQEQVTGTVALQDISKKIDDILGIMDTRRAGAK